MSRVHSFLFFVLLSLVFAGPGRADTLIRDATILTVSNGTIENASLLIRGGKIAAIGKDLSAPDGAEVIDAAGKFISPGIIDCHAHIAVAAINEGSVPVSSMVAIKDVLNPDDIAIYRALAGGVTSANVLHGSANPIGGQCAVIKLRWGADAAGLIFEGAPPGIKFALGENPKKSNAPQRGELHPSTRHGVIDVIRQAFVEAKLYRKEWDEYRSRQTAGRARLIPPRRDLRLEPLVEVLEGKRLVHAHCYRADEILALLRVAEDVGFKITTLQHVLEGYKVAKEIAAHGAGASTFSDWWTYKVEAQDAIPYNAAIMMRKGVLVSINSDSVSGGSGSVRDIRYLNQEAAKTMKWGGLSEEEALKLITLNPAKQLKIDDRVGSIEVGKDADLVIWDRHPLSVYAKALTTFIDGEIYFDHERDLQLREELAAEKQRLLAIEKDKDKAKAKADNEKGKQGEQAKDEGEKTP